MRDIHATHALQLPSGRAAIAALATATVLVAGLCAGNAAHARSDVSWSLGIGAPGVSVGVTNGYGYGAPAYVAAPVYNSYPAPVYVQPPRVVYSPPVYYAPRPVYYAPPVVYREPPRYYQGPRGHGFVDRNGDGRPDYRRGNGHGRGHGHDYR